MHGTRIKTIFVIGPTATGKTRLAVAVARKFNGEIIGADSRQVYRGLDIGTGKDLDEFADAAGTVPYHLIDIVEADDEYNVFRYKNDARQALAEINARARLPVVAGGSPLYVKALLDNYELDGGPPNRELRSQLQKLSKTELIARLRQTAPERLDSTDTSQRQRIIRAIEMAANQELRTPQFAEPAIEVEPLVIAPYYPRKTVHERIEKRLDERLKNGMVEEVADLHENGLSWQRLDDLGLEYRYLARYLQGQLTFKKMREQLFIHIRRFCKAQDVWHRKFERDGLHIHWLPEGNQEIAFTLVEQFLNNMHIEEPSFKLNDITYGPRSQ